MTLSITISVVDDDQQVRESLVALLQSTRFKVACYASGRQFLSTYSEARPGCVVLDLRLPGQSGLEILQELAARRVRAPVIMISGHGDITAAVSAMKAGAFDFLEKPYRGAVLVDCVCRAIEIDLERRRIENEHERLRARFATLTPQEQEVLWLTMAGKPDKAIAARLDVSLRTIQLRRASVMRKLGVGCRTELICVAQGHRSAIERAIGGTTSDSGLAFAGRASIPAMGAPAGWAAS